MDTQLAVDGHSPQRRDDLDEALRNAAAAIRDCDAVLISAAAGMSVPAGVNYFDKEFFAKHYPAMVKRGFSYCYQLVGHPSLAEDPRLLWGYMLCHAAAVGAVPAPHPVYSDLRRLIGDRPHFVITTNADGLFTRPESPFASSRVFTPQGSWRFVQCLKPCADDSVFPSAPYLKDLLPLVDLETQLLPAERVPRCPRCGGPMMFNANGGAWYRDTGYATEKAAFRAFMSEYAAKRLVIMEIGAGWNTPGVLRIPNERQTFQNPLTTLIRCNLDAEAAEVPPQLQSRGLALCAPIEYILSELLATVGGDADSSVNHVAPPTRT